MKRLPLSSPLLAATLFLAAGLRGEEAKLKPAAAMRAARQAELLKRFDKNGDGKLDDDERIAAKEEMMKEQLDRQAARLAAEKEKAEKAEKAENSTGTTASTTATPASATATSTAAATAPAKTVASAAAVAAPGPGAGMRAELLRRLDRNGDGKIDEVELADGVNFIAANIDQYPMLKQRFDRNGDGRLDDRERIALDEGLHQLVQGARRAPAPALVKDAPFDPADEANVAKVMEEFAPRFDAGKKPEKK